MNAFFEVVAVLFVIGCWITWPVMCHNLARTKNKDIDKAILGGIFLGIFAVLYYLTVTAESKSEPKTYFTDKPPGG